MDWLNLASVLEPGHIIKTQTSMSNFWSINVALKINGDVMVIPYIEEYFMSTVLANDVIKCKFLIGEQEVTLFCVVKEINFNSPSTLQLKVMKIDAWKNQRSAVRYDSYHLCRIITENHDECVAVLTNISDTGAALVCMAQLATGSNIKIDFSLDDLQPKCIYASIMRTRKTIDNKLEYGIKFYNVSKEERERISWIIRQVKDKEEATHVKACNIYGIMPRRI